MSGIKNRSLSDLTGKKVNKPKSYGNPMFDPETIKVVLSTLPYKIKVLIFYAVLSLVIGMLFQLYSLLKLILLCF